MVCALLRLSAEGEDPQHVCVQCAAAKCLGADSSNPNLRVLTCASVQPEVHVVPLCTQDTFSQQ